MKLKGTRVQASMKSSGTVKPEKTAIDARCVNQLSWAGLSS